MFVMACELCSLPRVRVVKAAGWGHVRESSFKKGLGFRLIFSSGLAQDTRSFIISGPRTPFSPVEHHSARMGEHLVMGVFLI